MPRTPSLSQISGLSDMIAARTGLWFPEERGADLVRGLKAAGAELGFENLDAFARGLTAQNLTTQHIETIASHLTVGETYFYRDPRSFEVLEREILPSLIATRADAAPGRTLRLWSAGCCTGEEAYSLAISCARALPLAGLAAAAAAKRISVLGTDINVKFLAKARAGLYSHWSFRNEPEWLRPRYFSAEPDGKWSVTPAVRSLVQFDYLNLADDGYPSLSNHTNAMDVIFCRNVLMYFTPAQQRRVAEGLHRCLVDGGYLLVNPAEASASLFSMFAIEHFGDLIAFRKMAPSSRVVVPAVALETAAEVERPLPMMPAPPQPPVVAPVSEPAPETPLMRARACANDGRLNAAVILCRDVLAADPTNHLAYFLHATICLELGLRRDAVAALEKVLYLEPDFILAHHALAGLHRQLGKFRAARRHHGIALALLEARDRDEIVPESDGMTCRGLIEALLPKAGPE